MASIVVAGDTSGTVTLSAPATAGTTTLTLPTTSGTVLTSASTITPSAGTVNQAALATGVAGTGPAFSAYLASSQTVTSATYTKLTFNTKVFDTNSNFDATTNYRFTPTVAGYYQVTLNIEGGANATGLTGAIYKNGSVYSYATIGAGITGFGSEVICNALIYMNGSTDYIEGYVYTTGGLLQALGGATNTQFSAFLARSA